MNWSFTVIKLLTTLIAIRVPLSLTDGCRYRDPYTNTGPSSGSPPAEKEEGLCEPGEVMVKTGKPPQSADLNSWNYKVSGQQ